MSFGVGHHHLPLTVVGGVGPFDPHRTQGLGPLGRRVHLRWGVQHESGVPGGGGRFPGRGAGARRAASPMACAPVEQAVTTAWFGPLKPYLMDSCPEAKLINADGIKNGEIRRGPFSCSSTAVSAIAFNPPMPEPISTPVRTFSS